MATVVMVKEIRAVLGGYVVEARWPYGDNTPFGEVVCKTIDEVIDLIKATDPTWSEDDDE